MSPDQRSTRRFLIGLAIAVAVLSVLPFVFGTLIAPAGSRYIGFQYNTDDHMVYAAWMRQAMQGRFLMDNRFAVDPQPGLTIHLYFWALGLLAKLSGIPLAAAIARFVFGGAFVLLLHRLIGLVVDDRRMEQICLLVAVFGAGIGFLTWQALGKDFYASSESPLKGLLLGGLPNDVWQPEAFTFPSLLTNSLFSVSLCLVIGIFICVLRARDSWKPVPMGAAGFLLLMNIHSYDVLLLGLVLLGLLLMGVVKKQVSSLWAVRVLVIAMGAVPAALWFMFVLKHDPVFQARAATETYTENFRSLLGGYVLLMILAAIGALTRAQELRADKRFLAGHVLLAVLFATLFLLAGHNVQGYWLGMGSWLLLFAAMLGILALLAQEHMGLNLIVSWACIGVIAPYFPGLFERKLMMGLSIPWGILAGMGLVYATRTLKASERRLVAALGLILISATSARWLKREFQMIVANASNTTMQPAFLSEDAAKVIDYLSTRSDKGRQVVIAMPGLSASGEQLKPPIFADLNPILSGFTGVYTYAGHWSETPDYNRRRSIATRFFLGMPLDERRHVAGLIGATYILAPVPEGLPFLKGILPLADVRDMGETVVEGRQIRLIRLTH
jgi:hypothetical protein